MNWVLTKTKDTHNFQILDLSLKQIRLVGGFIFFKHAEKTIAYTSFSLSGVEFPIEVLIDFCKCNVLFNPGFAMFEALAGVVIDTA